VRRFAALLLLVAACERPAPAPHGHLPPDIQMDQVTMKQFRGSQTRVTVTASHLEMMRGSGDFSMTDASVRLEAQGLTVQAPQVTGNVNAGVLEGFGGLTLTTGDGLTGTTGRARFEKDLGPEGGATSDAGVHLEHARFTLDAKSFRVDFASGTATFEEPVTRSR
jgi:hypothetical protein